MTFTLFLSLAVALSPLFLTTAFSDAVDDTVSWAKAPHHAPSYSPTVAPAPHHHHHKPASPPVSRVPSHAPVAAPAPHHHHHKGGHHHLAPVHVPSKAPVQPPIVSRPPVHPPLPERKLVAVQGVVYCKACKYKGVDTLLGATPLKGAVVLLSCNNTKYPLTVKGTTDHNGYFFITPPKTLTTYGAHRCRVTLLTSPLATCSQPTDLHYGIKGELLVPNHVPSASSPSPSVSPVAHPLPYEVFTVGPFAFEPSSKIPCVHESLVG